MKRIIQIAVVTMFTLGQVFPYQLAYAQEPIPTSSYDSPSPEIAIDTNSESQDQPPTESTDTIEFLAPMDQNPISRAAEEEPQFILPGDVNHDLKVDSQDLIAVFQAGKYETGQTAAYEEGDIDGNGFVESADLVLLMQNYEREVLHHIPFGDGQLVIEKDANTRTVARVFVPTSQEPLVEFEIEEGFGIEVQEPNVTGLVLTIISARTIDGKSLRFWSWTQGQDGQGTFSSYDIEERVMSNLLGEELRRQHSYSLRQVGETYQFQPTGDFLWDATQRLPIQQVFYSPNLETGISYLSQFSYYQRSGSQSGTVFTLHLPSQLIDSRLPYLNLIDASGTKVLFGGDLADYSFTREESTGLLKTLTAFSEDDRHISVVVTRDGLEVEIRP